MDYIKQNRIMGWSVVVLVVMNALALGTLWRTRLAPSDSQFMMPSRGFGQGQGRGARRGAGGPDVLGFIEGELNLDPNQTLAFRELRKQLFEDSMRIQHKIHTQKQAMMQAAFAELPDPNQIETLAESIGQSFSSMEVAQAKHFAEIKALCNPEQKARFAALLGDVLRRTRPQGPGPRPGRGEGPMRGNRRRGDPMNGPPGGPGPPPMNGF